MDGSELRQTANEREQDLVEAGIAHLGLELDTGSAENPSPAGQSDVRRGIQEPGLADTGLARHEQGSAIGPSRGNECSDAVDLRDAPDEEVGVATVALPSAVLRGVGVDHGRYPRATGALQVTADIAVSLACILSACRVANKHPAPDFGSCDA